MNRYQVTVDPHRPGYDQVVIEGLADENTMRTIEAMVQCMVWSDLDAKLLVQSEEWKQVMP